MLPAKMGPMGPTLVTTISDCVEMDVEAVAVLLRRLLSVETVETEAVLLMVPPLGVLDSDRTTTVKFAEAPEARVAMVPLMVPVPPTRGLVMVNAGPEVCESETNVVLAGMMSDNRTVCASLGPVLATVMV